MVGFDWIRGLISNMMFGTVELNNVYGAQSTSVLLKILHLQLPSVCLLVNMDYVDPSRHFLLFTYYCQVSTTYLRRDF